MLLYSSRYFLIYPFILCIFCAASVQCEEDKKFTFLKAATCTCEKSKYCKCCVDFRKFFLPMPHEACMTQKSDDTAIITIDGNDIYDSKKKRPGKEECLWIRFGSNICIQILSLRYVKELDAIVACGRGEIKYLRTSVYKWNKFCLSFGEKLYQMVLKIDVIANQIINLFEK